MTQALHISNFILFLKLIQRQILFKDKVRFKSYIQINRSNILFLSILLIYDITYKILISKTDIDEKLAEVYLTKTEEKALLT